METRAVMNSAEVQAYAETRLFGTNIRPHHVHTIELHNGKLPSTLEAHIAGRFGHPPVRVEQENGREPLYFLEGRLFIPQYSGFGRADRYETLITAYNRTLEHRKGFFIRNLEDDPRKTAIAYDNYAYDFVRDLFCGGDLRMHMTTTIIVGPTAAVAKQARAPETREDEYLDSQFVDADGTTALNIGYIYADQAGTIFDKMLREYAALGMKRRGEDGGRTHIRIFMLGRVGGLDSDMARGDLVYPTHIIDQVDLLRGTPLVYPMHNTLADDNGKSGLDLNVRNAVSETVELLEEARGLDCICTEMEAREAVESINRARRRYIDTLLIDFGYVGYVSDRPLVPGDTLARELDSDEGEQAAVRRILAYMKEERRIREVGMAQHSTSRAPEEA
jgi:hypothetical protein